MRLANLEVEAKHFDQAAFWMRQAVEVRPDSPEVLYQLALVEEDDYEYGQALRDLARGLSLAPNDTRLRNHYRDMLRMIAAHRTTIIPQETHHNASVEVVLAFRDEYFRCAPSPDLECPRPP